MQTLNSTRLDIRHLKLLVAVADQGSITNAARTLHLTQSALSHQLHDAEERLQTKLFLRHRKKMILTPAGQDLMLTSRRLLSDLRQAEEQIRMGEKQDEGTIRFATECYVCYHWWPKLLLKFRALYPKVDIAIDVEAASRPVDAVLEGRPCQRPAAPEHGDDNGAISPRQGSQEQELRAGPDRNLPVHGRFPP